MSTPEGRPQAMSDVMADLLARRDYARVQTASRFEEAWRCAAGDAVAEQTRVATLRRGVLDVIVSSSTLVQEITFLKPEILAKLAGQLPDDSVSDLRLRVGPVG